MKKKLTLTFHFVAGSTFQEETMLTSMRVFGEALCTQAAHGHRGNIASFYVSDGEGGHWGGSCLDGKYQPTEPADSAT